jgi:hypothetical protein
MKRIILIVSLYCVAALNAVAAVMSGGGPPDPFTLQESLIVPALGLWANNAGFNDTQFIGTRTLRASPQINTGVANLVLILAGQSNVASEAPSAYSPTNSTVVDNLNIYDGGIYAWADPPLGSTWAYQSFGGTGSTCGTLQSCGHVGARISDLFINAGTFARVIVAPVAVGGTTISQWDTGPLSNRICVAIGRLANRGITPSVTNVTFAIVWGQGESETTSTTLQYQTAITNILNRAKACGFSGRFFVNKETFGAGATNANVQSAQTGIVDSVNFWAGANADALTGTACSASACRRADNTHFTDAGATSLAAAIQSAMHASGAPY